MSGRVCVFVQSRGAAGGAGGAGGAAGMECGVTAAGARAPFHAHAHASAPAPAHAALSPTERSPAKTGLHVNFSDKGEVRPN